MLPLFVCAAICAVPVQQLDELILGEWTVLATEFRATNASDSNISYYTIIVEETRDQGIFSGKIYLREGEESASLIENIKIAFDHSNKAHATLSIGENGVQIADAIFNETKGGLRVSLGTLDTATTTFSISIFSYKTIEAIVMDSETNTVTIYRMLRAVSDGKSGQGSSGGVFQYLPIILIAYFLFGRKSKEQNADTQPTENTEDAEPSEKQEVDGEAEEWIRLIKHV